MRWWEENRRREQDQLTAPSNSRGTAAPRARIDVGSKVARDRLRVAADMHGDREAAEPGAEEAERRPPERRQR